MTSATAPATTDCMTVHWRVVPVAPGDMGRAAAQTHPHPSPNHCISHCPLSRTSTTSQYQHPPPAATHDDNRRPAHTWSETEKNMNNQEGHWDSANLRQRCADFTVGSYLAVLINRSTLTGWNCFSICMSVATGINMLMSLKQSTVVSVFYFCHTDSSWRMSCWMLERLSNKMWTVDCHILRVMADVCFLLSF